MSSKSIKLIAKSITPLSFGKFKLAGAFLILFNGMNVARPAPLDFKSSIALDARIEEGHNFIKTETPNTDRISAKLDKLEAKDMELQTTILDIQAEIDEVEKLLDNDALKTLKEKTAEFEDNIKRLNHDKLVAQNDITVANKEISFNETLINTRENDIKETEKKNKG